MAKPVFRSTLPDMSELQRRRPVRSLALVLAVLATAAAAAVGGAAGASATVLPAGATGSAPSSATVTLVHGVRGLLADVVVDGKTVLKGFAYERASAPMNLPAGTHRVEVYAAGSPHTTALLDVQLTVKGGQILTAAVGFDSTGAPKVYVFDNSLTSAAHSPSSIVVRNVSQGSAPEVLVDGKAIKSALGAGAQTIDPVRPGNHTVGLKVGGAWLLTNQPVRAASGKAMVVYIVGRQSAKSIALVADSVTPSTSAAGSVNSGGLPPLQSGPMVPTWASMTLLGSGLVLLLALARRRRPLELLTVRRGVPHAD
jgi:Domain of unknown function (DUF4397)